MLHDKKYGRVSLENEPESAQDVNDEINEPVFVLRAQDAFAMPLLHRYANFARQAGEDAAKPVRDQMATLLNAVNGVITEFQHWQDTHADRVKLPD